MAEKKNQPNQPTEAEEGPGGHLRLPIVRTVPAPNKFVIDMHGVKITVECDEARAGDPEWVESRDSLGGTATFMMTMAMLLTVRGYFAYFSAMAKHVGQFSDGLRVHMTERGLWEE